MKPAGFWIRSVAFLIDLILLNLVELTVETVLAQIGGLSAFTQQVVLGIPLSIAFYVWYYLFYQVNHQATLGKRWLGLRVISTDGSDFTRGQAALRVFGYLPSLLMVGCGFLMVAFHPDKFAFHDLISRTRVVRMPKSPA